MALVDVMGRFPDSLVIQDVCVDISPDQPGTLPMETQRHVLVHVIRTLERAERGGFGIHDFRIPAICENAFRIFARLLCLPELLQRCGDDQHMVEVPLAEVFRALDIFSGPLSEYWSLADSAGKDMQQKMRHKELLMKIAGQLSEVQKTEARSVLSWATHWIQQGAEFDRGLSQRRYLMERRMLFVGVLFDGESTIASVLFEALERGFSSLVAGSEGVGFEEELITSALRASIELKSLGLLKPSLSRETRANKDVHAYVYDSCTCISMQICI